MSVDTILSSVSYYGSFAWVYGIKSDLWTAAVASYGKNFNQLSKPHLITLIDYRVASNKPRLWTLNFFAAMPALVCNTLVAHGKGSGAGPTMKSVSREMGSNQSCVGGFVTLQIYRSKLGQANKTEKRPAMVVEGLDTSNRNARNRGIRVHGAHYVHDCYASTSNGGICCKQEVHEALIKIIHGGSFMFSYFGDEFVEL